MINPKPNPRDPAFTLIEMLVVIGVISILLVAVIPAVNSLSKSNGRKTAITNLLGAIEQARAQAIKDGQATYVVFPTFSTGTPNATLDRYNYRCYAIFEDNPADAAVPKQLTPWKTLPTGVSLRSTSLASLPDSTADLTPPITLVFAPDSSATPAFRCIKFNSEGGVDTPAVNVSLSVFEGFVNGGTEVLTKTPIVVETLSIAHLTGRAQHSL